METNKNNLFSDFKPLTKQEWMNKVNIDLKGENFNRKLVWKHLNDIDFQPFYCAEDASKHLANTGENAESLINYRTIQVQFAESGNKQALKAIKEGVTGLVFNLKENVSVTKLLNKININEIAVSFTLTENAIGFVKDFFDFSDQNITNNKNLRGYLDLGIISNYLTTGHYNMLHFEALKHLVNLSKEYPNFKAITISGTTYLDSGANQVQEVAYTLNSLIYVIEHCLERGVYIESIFNNLHVELAIGSEYFIEIGKFRAFNSLLHEIAKTYGISNLH